jgi:uncharacterized protein (DUF58 family)
MSTLFPEPFLTAISHLRIAARRTRPGGHHGEHLSRRAGAGMEFRDYRAYAPGDDLRRVDWNVYRRSRRLYLRLADEPRDLPVHVLLDASDSMYFENPPRADAGRQMAAAVVAAAMHQHDRVSLYAMGDQLGPPLKPAGPAGLPRFLDELAAIGPRGGTALAGCLRRFSTLPVPRGLAVLISDLFDPQGIAPVLEALAGLRHRLAIVQLTRPSDREPALEGDLELIDCETGSPMLVTASAGELDGYRNRYDAFQEAVREHAHRTGAGLARVDCDQPVLAQLDRLFVHGVLRV